MRWLAILTVLATATATASKPADARPARFDDDDYRRTACPRSASWDKVARCQLKGVKYELVHDLAAAKLVSYELAYARGSKRLELYILADQAWIKSALYIETNPSNELLGFAPTSGGAYRIDIGIAQQTWVSLDTFGSRPGMIRRTFTHVCTATHGCRSVQTSCDLLVRGRAIATFRGVAKWDGSTLRVSGVAQNTNRYCAAPPNLIEPEAVP
jgi:hypothetical protein